MYLRSNLFRNTRAPLRLGALLGVWLGILPALAWAQAGFIPLPAFSPPNPVVLTEQKLESLYDFNELFAPYHPSPLVLATHDIYYPKPQATGHTPDGSAPAPAQSPPAPVAPAELPAAGPYPAIVLLVDGALAPSSLEMELITILTQAGYAVLPVDTRSAMQHPAFNQQRPRNRPAFVDQQQIQATVNAHRALQFLEHQPQIDAQRVAVMGLGNTSPAIRMLMDTRVQQKLAHQPDAAFAVHVELYNHCDVYFDTDTTTGAPLISFRQMFMSVKDRQACAEQDLILNTAGSPIEVYGNTVGAPSRYKKLADQAASSTTTPEAFCVQAHCRPLEKRGSLLAPPIFTRQLLQALGGHLQEQR